MGCAEEEGEAVRVLVAGWRDGGMVAGEEGTKKNINGFFSFFLLQRSDGLDLHMYSTLALQFLLSSLLFRLLPCCMHCTCFVQYNFLGFLGTIHLMNINYCLERSVQK